MEDLYLLEFHVLKVKFRCKELGDQDPKLTVNCVFGTFATFEICQEEFAFDTMTEEAELALKEDAKRTQDLATECAALLAEEGDTTFTAEMREFMSKKEIQMNCGASILFSQNPQGLKQAFDLFPLNLSVWADAMQRRRECVGVCKHIWDPKIKNSIEQANMCCYKIDPSCVKIVEPLYSEVTGSAMGEITMLIRITCLGGACITRFKEVNRGNAFIFRNRGMNKSYKCKNHGIDAKPETLIPIGVLYECMEIKDPDDVEAEHRRKQVSKELEAAGLDEECIMFVTGDKGRNAFGCCDIPFPCGNPECTLIKMIKDYLKKPGCYDVGNKGKGSDCCENPLPKKDCDPAGSSKATNICVTIPSCCTSCIDETAPTCPTITPCDCEPIPTCPASCRNVDHSQCGKCLGTCGEGKKDESDLERLVYEGLTKMLFANKDGKGKKCG